jgi:hypothetical protein
MLKAALDVAAKLRAKPMFEASLQIFPLIGLAPATVAPSRHGNATGADAL